MRRSNGLLGILGVVLLLFACVAYALTPWGSELRGPLRGSAGVFRCRWPDSRNVVRDHCCLRAIPQRGVDHHRVLHIFDFGLRASAERWGSGAEADDVRERFEDAFRAVWEGRAESDGLNALVLGAGLRWRQVVILRTVAKYLRQTGSTFSQDYVESALVAHTGIARSLVELFETRFDPDAFGDPTETGRDQRAARQKAIVAVMERSGTG